MCRLQLLCSIIFTCCVVVTIHAQSPKSIRRSRQQVTRRSLSGLAGRCECMSYKQCDLRSGRVLSYCFADRVCCLTKTNHSTTLSIEEKLIHRLMRNLLFRNESTLPATDSSKQSGNNGGATVVKPSGVGQSNGKKKKNKKPVKSNKNGTKTDRRSDRKVRDCGRKGLEDSSLELGNALPGEWPWHIAVLSKQEQLFMCGGSLVDTNYVLTAAHCLQNYKANDIKVRFGEYDYTHNREPETYHEEDVAELFIHDQFDEQTLANDMALLRLRNGAPNRSNIQQICLPSSSMMNASNRSASMSTCVVTGWGQTTLGEYAEQLKEIPVRFWNRKRCARNLKAQAFGSTFRLPRNAFCAIGVHKDACDGDGGGPLVCKHSDRWYQFGILSFGFGCEQKEMPNVYTDLMALTDWINDIMYNFDLD